MLWDSFISRLSYYAQGDINRGSLELGEAVDLRWCGVPGATAERLASSTKVANSINNSRPQVIVVQVGFNDLCTARSKADA